MLQPLWKTLWQFLKKLKLELPYDSANSLLEVCMYLEELKARSQRDIFTPMFIVALFTIGKMWKQAKCQLINEWINKVLYTYNGRLFSLEEEEILIHATTWMNFEDIMLCEISQSQKDKCCMYDFTYMRYLN